MAPESWLESLEATPVAVFVRESPYGFALVVGCHLLSLMWSAGIVIWFDLRLLGVVMSDRPVSRVYRRLMPMAFAGFVVAMSSGVVLAIAYATSAYPNPFFRLKLLALLAAGVNAAHYHWRTSRAIADWDAAARPPSSARAAGVISIVLWTAVMMLGRAMSYTMF